MDNIKTGFAFQVNNSYSQNVKLRKTADITDDIGHIIRVGYMDDSSAYHDVGTLISKNFDNKNYGKNAHIVIRSFRTGDLVAYDMNCTNSSVYDVIDIKVHQHFSDVKNCISLTLDV